MTAILRWLLFFHVHLLSIHSRVTSLPRRAALRVHGFGSRLNAPLEAVMDEAQAACVARRMSAAAQQAQQQRWDGAEAPPPAGYKGTVLREGAFLALLDIGQLCVWKCTA